MRANVQLLIDAFHAKCDEIVALHFAGPGEWGACSKLTSYAAAESNFAQKTLGLGLKQCKKLIPIDDAQNYWEKTNRFFRS